MLYFITAALFGSRTVYLMFILKSVVTKKTTKNVVLIMWLNRFSSVLHLI